MSKRYKNVTDEDLLKLLKDYGEKIGTTPSSVIMHKERDQMLPDIGTYERRFGSWKNALVLAGFKNIHRNISIKDKRPDVVESLKFKEDANLSYGSEKKVLTVCPICKKERYVSIKYLCRNGYSCTKCGKNPSKSELAMESILDQLNISYEQEKIFEWSNRKRYDFYLNKENCIIEINGEQHYLKGIFRTLKEEKENDEYKKEIALKNGINKYFSIEIKSTSNSKLIKSLLNDNNIKNLINNKPIDIIKIYENIWHRDKDIMKSCCDLYNQGFALPDISKSLNIENSRLTILLKDACKIGLCDYNKKYAYEKKKRLPKNGHCTKEVYCKETDKKYSSAKEAYKELSSKVKDKFVYSNFCESCNGKRENYYKGFHVYYVDKGETKCQLK